MKSITHVASMVVLTAAIGLGTTSPVYAGKPTVAVQSTSDYGAADRTGCHHPDRSKCRRATRRPMPVSQAVQEMRQSAEPRREGTQRCLKGAQPHRSPRRC